MNRLIKALLLLLTLTILAACEDKGIGENQFRQACEEQGLVVEEIMPWDYAKKTLCAKPAEPEVWSVIYCKYGNAEAASQGIQDEAACDGPWEIESSENSERYIHSGEPFLWYERVDNTCIYIRGADHPPEDFLAILRKIRNCSKITCTFPLV